MSSHTERNRPVPLPVGSLAAGPVPSATAAILMGKVARRYYLEGRSKVEIAQEVGISRFKVARLLDEALATGLVRIEINPLGEIDIDASTRLQDALGLDHVVVVTVADPAPAAVRRQVSAAAATLLGEVLEPTDVLGLPWSRSVYAMVQALRSLPPIEVVQLSGAQTLEGEDASAIEVVVQAARLAGTRGHVFYAPMLVDDVATADGLRREPQVMDALNEARRVTKAVVGIGHWAPGQSTIYDASTEADREQLRAAGVVGEMAAVCYDARGHVVRTPLDKRLITVPGDVLAAIPQVIAVATGVDRAPAVRAAVTGGLVSSLVVDDALARALLAG